MLKQFFQKIPKLPLSALIFYVGVVILSKFGYIPSPHGILLFLEDLYNSYGLSGLFLASFLEGIVYLGLYFPGSFIVALAVILSDGTFISLLSISFVVAVALTVTSSINYILGRKIFTNKFGNELLEKKESIFSKGLLVSMLHPNALAFYFFNLGIKKQNFLKILLVPLFMFPYGLALGYLFYLTKEPLKAAIESPYIMISAISFWIVVAFLLEGRGGMFHKKQITIKNTKKDVKYFGPIFWLHLILIVFAYLSPFLFDWKVIILVIVLLFIQYYLFGGCLLNKVQFDDTTDTVFLYPYLTMLGLKLDSYKFKIFIRYYLPFILLFIAIIWQVVLDRPPLLF